MKTIAERLRHARDEKGWSQAHLASAAGVSQSTIGNIEAGIRQARGSLPQIAKALGVSHDWLADDDGPMKTNLPVNHLVAEPVKVYAVTENDPNILQIPLLANAASMGPGGESLHEDVLTGHLPINPAWIARRISPTNVKALRFIHAHGDSMSPTFGDGDILLVDTGVINPSEADGVYVLEAHNSLFIKRVSRRFDGAFDVTSDNPTVKTTGLLDGSNNVRILGRVVWSWNGHKL